MKALFNGRVKIRPSINGVALLLVCLATFLLAVNYSNNLLFTFSFLQLSVLLVSFWLTLANIAGISGQCSAFKPVHAGQMLSYSLVVQNSTSGMKYELFLDKDAKAFTLSGSEHRVVEVQRSALKRGLAPEVALFLHSDWPLGLFHVSRRLCVGAEGWIYPRSFANAPLVFRLTGQQAHRLDASDELSGLRGYQAGDSLHRVHWRAFAKNDSLQIRQFDGEQGEPSGWLEWGDTQGDYEERISCLTAWVLDAFGAGKEFGLQLPGEQIPPARGAVQLQKCLAALAKMPELVR